MTRALPPRLTKGSLQGENMNQSRWPSRRLPGPRMVAALAAAGCAALSLAAAGGAVASGSVVAAPRSVAVAPGSVVPRAAAVRFGALRLGSARPGRPEQAALSRLGNAGQARPGRSGGSVGAGRQPRCTRPPTRRQTPSTCRSSAAPASVIRPPGPCRGCDQRREMQHEGQFGLPGGGQGEGRQQPARGGYRHRTDTVYVVNGTSNTVSVLNGARCNARVTRGCGRPVATVKVGKFPVAAVVQPGDAHAVCGEPCGWQCLGDQRGQRATRRRPGDAGSRPGLSRTRPARPGSMWTPRPTPSTRRTPAPGQWRHGVGDQRRHLQRAHRHAAAGESRATVRWAAAPFGVAVDQATDTVYVPNNNDGTVSVINGARCNARVTSGCGRTPPTVTTGANPQFVAADPGRHTVFTINQSDDTLSAINTRTCNGTVTSGCRRSRRACRPPQPGPGVQLVPERVRAGPPHRLRVRSERGRRQHLVGDQHPPLQRHQHHRLPPPGAERPGRRVPAVRRPGHQHHLRRQPHQAADRRDQRRHLPRPATWPAAPRSRRSR